MSDRIRRAAVGDIEIAYETFGDPADPAVLLIMGLGSQMLSWPAPLIAGLNARGFFAIRYDNRDVGLSTHLSSAPPGDIGAIFAGDLSSASYSLSDMAADAMGLLDALGIAAAHVVGVSMGGMIAQTVAIEHPSRVLSLVSIMSTTGDPSVGHATEAAVGALMAPPATTREEALDRSVASSRVIGSPGFAIDEEALRERAGLAYDRANDPVGVTRQVAAIWVSGDRTARLADVRVPTLVIHGGDDPLVNVSGGEATAAAIVGAELEVIPGMGHDLPRDLWPRYVELIAANAARVPA